VTEAAAIEAAVVVLFGLDDAQRKRLAINPRRQRLPPSQLGTEEWMR
jgi:hypothetical protein